MVKYCIEDYNKAIELHKKGYGSLKISKILGFKNRGVIEDWINKGRKPYYFSDKRISACNSESNIKRLIEIGKKNHKKAIKASAELRTKRLKESSKKLSEELAYILGVCYGDGHISIEQRRVILSATDRDFVLNFKENLEKWSGFKARFYSRELKKPEYIKNRKIQYVSYIDSKEASLFLKKFNLNKLQNSNSLIKRAFLKGFYDSEGHVDKNGRIICYNINKNTIVLVKNILKSMNIITILKEYPINGPNTKAKTIYTLNINNILNKTRYFDLVGFSIQRKFEKLKKYLKEATMTESTEQLKRDHNVVFIGSKPFMKLQ